MPAPTPPAYRLLSLRSNFQFCSMSLQSLPGKISDLQSALGSSIATLMFCKVRGIEKTRVRARPASGSFTERIVCFNTFNSVKPELYEEGHFFTPFSVHTGFGIEESFACVQKFGPHAVLPCPGWRARPAHANQLIDLEQLRRRSLLLRSCRGSSSEVGGGVS